MKKYYPKRLKVKHLLVYFFLILDLILFTSFISLSKIKNTSQENLYPELAQLRNQGFSFQDLSKFFTVLAEKKGAKYAYDVLKIAPIPPGIDMHLLGHVVGDVLYKQQGYKGIKICTPDFRNACSHSIVINLLLEKGEKALSDIAQACREAPGGKGAYTMCFHGLGHGVLAYANYDLEKAIAVCKKTGTPAYHNREYIECVGGTIMEIIGGGGGHDPDLWKKQSQKYLKKDSPLLPCSSDFMPAEVRSQCYVYLTPHLFEVSGADLGNPTEENYKKAFTYCEKIPLSAKADRDACFGGFGKEFVVLAKDRDIRNIQNMTDKELQRVYSWCMLANDENGKNQCLIYSMQSIYWGGENDRRTAINFCSLIQESTQQSSCFFELIGAVDYYALNTGYKKSFCGEIPKTYQTDCNTRLNL